jgi:uncharacterized protein (DUF427 family)
MPVSQTAARITITPRKGRLIVRAAHILIADTLRALVLKEGGYPPVLYIPRADIDMTRLEPSAIRSHCPRKGQASYFSLAQGGYRSTHIGWSYEQPHDAVAAIAGHIAFHPDRFIAIEEARPEEQP